MACPLRNTDRFLGPARASLRFLAPELARLALKTEAGALMRLYLKISQL
jgi:hypothetical protein